jgi:hypothetical protein
MRCVLIAGSIALCCIGLPAYFVQYRSEPLHCNWQRSSSCFVDDQKNLVLALGMTGRPPADFQIQGIYTRRGYDPALAEVLGIALPFLLFCGLVVSCVRIRQPMNPR